MEDGEIVAVLAMSRGRSSVDLKQSYTFQGAEMLGRTSSSAHDREDLCFELTPFSRPPSLEPNPLSPFLHLTRPKDSSTFSHQHPRHETSAMQCLVRNQRQWAFEGSQTQSRTPKPKIDDVNTAPKIELLLEIQVEAIPRPLKVKAVSKPQK